MNHLLLSFYITLDVISTVTSNFFVRGKMILPSHGKEFFTSYGKHFFTYLGNKFFTRGGKDFFTRPGKQIFTSSVVSSCMR